MRTLSFLLLFLASEVRTCLGEDPWSFIVLADPHSFEQFAYTTASDELYQEQYTANVIAIKHIKDTYGGDFVMIPGDTNSGVWYTKDFARKMGNPSLSAKEVIARASKGCYGTLRKNFEDAGYAQPPMVAIGDHEIGGNPWRNGVRTTSLQDFREGFQKELNRYENGNFMYTDPIGSVPSRPIGTIYENTSYARKYKNVLFVTVDCFHTMGYGFIDRENGLGGEGTVNISVEGEHLSWVERVLIARQNDPSIKHVIVQAHVPIVQSVRKVRCSGQFFDRGEESKYFYAARNIWFEERNSNFISNLI